MGRRLGWLILIALSNAAQAEGEKPPPPALRVRLVRPDRQCERIIALFEGTRAPHPAAAVAAWKRAHPGSRDLGKPMEALLSGINPEMVPELIPLDETEVVLGFDPATGSPRWRAIVPHDDGTIAAAATALVLTGGASEPPLNGQAVDRLGPPGAPLMSQVAGSQVLASTRADLQAVLSAHDGGCDPAGPPGEVPAALDSGLWLLLDPDSLATSPGPLARRRLGEGLRALGCREVEGVAALEGETLSVVLSGRLTDIPAGNPALDPSWLDWVPADRVAAAGAVALDPRPEAWAALFAVADRIERVDPTHAESVSWRTRLDLLALAAGVQPEVDLWPRLRGLTVCTLADPSGAVEGVLLALHATDEPAAERLARQVLPRLTLLARLGRPGPKPAPGAEPVRLGRVAGRDLEMTRRGSTVLIGWGAGTLPAGLEAARDSTRSAGPTIRAPWGPSPPSRAGALWPGRLPPRFVRSLPLPADSPPILWWGDHSGTSSRDELRWSSLRRLVRSSLDSLTLAPPLDPGG